MDYLIKLRKLLSRHAGRTQDGEVSPKALQGIVRQVQQTMEVEYTCDQVLDLLDQFAEAVLRGENVAVLMPLVQHHLDMCGDCREEFEALMRILRASPA